MNIIHHTFFNLARFEEFIAAYSDCIVLFPESHGSLAEIGFFSASNRIRAKLLVVNNIVMQAVDSFINNGPLALINAESDFRPVIHLKYRRNRADFSPVKQRLLRFPSIRRSRFTFDTYDVLAPNARIGIILEIINIFSPISLDGLTFVLDAIFQNTDYEDIKHIVSLAVAVEYISRVGNLGDLFSLHPNSKPLFSFRDREELSRIRLSVIDFYRQYATDLYALFGGFSVMSVLTTISTETGVPLSRLILIVRTADFRYKQYTIPKRSGGIRLIQHPARELKFLQRWVIDHVLKFARVHAAATAYLKGTSVRQNAAVHSNSKFFLRVDFTDFFPSITLKDVTNLLRNIEGPVILTEEDIELVSQILTRNGRLTIGAPSSPIISNAIMYEIDEEMIQLAKLHASVYSRYADDLIFSTSTPGMLTKLLQRVREYIAYRDSPKLQINEKKIVI